jgi:DNA-binding transcriptional ArsR family regulator
LPASPCAASASRRRARRSSGRNAARQAGIPALAAEVLEAQALLDAPAARLLAGGEERPLRLQDVEALQGSTALVVDAFRYVVRVEGIAVSLAGRPVLFALARTLAEAWPGDADRATLLARAFGARHADESHRARLRVEIGRLRAKLRPLAAIEATARGFVLEVRGDREVMVMARPVEEPHGEVLAFLADGEAWSSSALALALGASQRTVQRALDTLAEAGKVQSFGRGRARRWITPPLPRFTTTLLLPAAVADG